MELSNNLSLKQEDDVLPLNENGLISKSKRNGAGGYETSCKLFCSPGSSM